MLRPSKQQFPKSCAENRSVAQRLSFISADTLLGQPGATGTIGADVGPVPPTASHIPETNPGLPSAPLLSCPDWVASSGPGASDLQGERQTSSPRQD